jgi:hypothetical protein
MMNYELVSQLTDRFDFLSLDLPEMDRPPGAMSTGRPIEQPDNNPVSLPNRFPESRTNVPATGDGGLGALVSHSEKLCNNQESKHRSSHGLSG